MTNKERMIRRKMLKIQTVDQNSPLNEWVEKRCGFTPDLLVRAVGVTMGESAKKRQKYLEKAKAFQGPDKAPPARLVREPDNPYDKDAVKVYVGIDIEVKCGKTKWTFAHIGYLPKGLNIPVRSDGDRKAVQSVASVMDQLEDGSLPGRLLCGVDFVAKAPGTSSWGLQLGLKHEV